MSDLRPGLVPHRRPASPPVPQLVDRVRRAVRVRHYSRRTEKAYVGWICRFAWFHGNRRPEDMGAAEVMRFLSSLAIERRVSPSTQNQAFSALVFLYREVLKRDLPGLDALRAKRPVHLPVVLSRPEVRAIVTQLRGTPRLMALLMYGSGLRLLECARLRIKDVGFDRREITVRDGKGRKDRVTMLPAKLVDRLRAHLLRVRDLHRGDLAAGHGAVAMPDALALKYPNAHREWAWQWVFPAARTYFDHVIGAYRRHHLHETVVQRAFKHAVRAPGVTKAASCHTLGTPSPRTCWNPATTSGPSRSCSATATSPRPWSTRTS